MLKKQAAVFVIVLISFSVCFAMGGRSGAPPKVGSPAPGFELQDLNGQTVKLSDLKGKVVFLNFWASWCPPCRKEMPSIQSLHEKMKNEKFAALAVKIESGTVSDAVQFIRKGKYAFRVVIDQNGEVARRYQVSSIPATFIIDREGRLVKKYIGARDWAEPGMVNEFKGLARAK